MELLEKIIPLVQNQSKQVIFSENILLHQDVESIFVFFSGSGGLRGLLVSGPRSTVLKGAAVEREEKSGFHSLVLGRKQVGSLLGALDHLVVFYTPKGNLQISDLLRQAWKMSWNWPPSAGFGLFFLLEERRHSSSLGAKCSTHHWVDSGPLVSTSGKVLSHRASVQKEVHLRSGPGCSLPSSPFPGHVHRHQ